MKHTDHTLFAVALVAIAALAAFAPRQSFAVTGAEAAAMISSDPDTRGTEKIAKYNVGLAYYDKAKKALEYTDVTIDDDTTYSDLEYIINSLQHTVSSAAYNALLALSKVAYVEGDVEYLNNRVDKLTKTTKDAFAALDELDIDAVADEVSFRLSKKKTTDGKTVYETKNFFGAEPDGKSIVKNAEKKLALHGFNLASGLNIPYVASGTLVWNNIGCLTDDSSLQKYDYGLPTYVNALRLKGWNSPTSEPNDCDESIAQQLSRLPNQPETHYVLTKHISDGNLHYAPLGRLAGVGSAPDEATITTNGVTKGVLQIKNADAKDKILVSATGGDSSAPAWTTPTEITVVKDIDFVTNGDGTIKLVLHREKIKCIPHDDSSVDDKDVTIATSAISLVSGTEYDESDHSFYDNVKTVRVIGTPSEDSRRATPTFTAVEHATE